MLPSYSDGKARDFYASIRLEAVDQAELYKALKECFTNVIAHSIDMQFSYEGSAEDRLNNSLRSAVCGSCGRLRLTYNTNNTSEMAYLLSQIQNTGRANEIMLNFLQEYTCINSANSNERLLLTCPGH